MSSKDLAVSVRGLSKAYTIAHNAPKHTMVGEMLMHRLRHPFARPEKETFWALKDVEFDIMKGEVVGIIGGNGAGKSTLLKILSRITKPTKGQIDLYGRVGSLLEVGTGFHPELTGRENIFLNGAILGMRKRETERQFDAIVDFAEVEKFLDTPVKRYSSGMYVRLAFAVAAHLNPEILVVDEVLAVGDASFQKKCLEKMEQVGKEGQTILFVSHNMGTVQTLCKRSIVLEKGQVIGDLPSSEAVKLYFQQSKGADFFERAPRSAGRATIVEGQLQKGGEGGESWIEISIKIASAESIQLALDVRLKDGIGAPVGFGSLGAMRPDDMIAIRPPFTQVKVRFSTHHLASGSYLLSLDLNIPSIEIYDRAENCLAFDMNRLPEPGALYTLPQGWNYGSLELPLIIPPSSLQTPYDDREHLSGLAATLKRGDEKASVTSS